MITAECSSDGRLRWGLLVRLEAPCGWEPAGHAHCAPTRRRPLRGVRPHPHPEGRGRAPQGPGPRNAVAGSSTGTRHRGGGQGSGADEGRPASAVTPGEAKAGARWVRCRRPRTQVQGADMQGSLPESPGGWVATTPSPLHPPTPIASAAPAAWAPLASTRALTRPGGNGDTGRKKKRRARR